MCFVIFNTIKGKRFLLDTVCIPMERQSRMTFDPGVVAIDNRVGLKNMHSSSGCAVIRRIVFP